MQLKKLAAKFVEEALGALATVSPGAEVRIDTKSAGILDRMGLANKLSEATSGNDRMKFLRFDENIAVFKKLS